MRERYGEPGWASAYPLVLVWKSERVVQGSSDSAAGVREGDILAGKYRVERVLGRGGMGVVVAAHHMQLDEKVALKFLLPEALGDAEAVARFAREARNAVKIKSEHVARVIDVGTLTNGAPYMVMEYLDGGDLAAWVKQSGALPVEQAIEFVLHACVAVAEAHALGIVHRDLKPANLFCVRRADGQLSIKVLDFGISKFTDRIGPVHGTMTAMALTKTSALMGSPLYMSPEQMRSSRDVDAQTDIWSLGVILFELVAGQPPFQAESVTELAIKVNNEPMPALRGFRPDVPNGLEAIVFKCLEKDRRERYRNVAELAVALLPLAPKRAKASVERISGIIQAAGMSASALAVPPSPPVTSTLVAPGTIAPVGRTASGAQGPPRRGALVGIALAGIFVVGAFAVAVRSRVAPPPGLVTATGPVITDGATTPPALPSSSAPIPVLDSSSLRTWPVSDLPSAPVKTARPTLPMNQTAPAHSVANTVSPTPPVTSAPSPKPTYDPMGHL